MEQDRDVVLEGESYRKNEVFGFRELFLMQIRRVINNQSKEMKDGWWKKSFAVGGQAEVVTSYIGDTRKEFINSIQALHDLSQPKFDKDMKTESKRIHELHKVEHTEAIEKFDVAEGDERRDISSDWGIRNVEIYRELFQQLCYFAERKNWFESGVKEE